MSAYYNEIDEAAAWALNQLIADGVIAPGVVDTRSIKEVSPDDLRGFTQCHFFAGAGLWSVAARLAGWPDDKPLWSGSCPCQPFSQAGKRAGTDDPRHLWPDFFRLIGACRPDAIVGEQVAGTAGRGWLAGVRADLEAGGYAFMAVDIPAGAIGAPHDSRNMNKTMELAAGTPLTTTGPTPDGSDATTEKRGVPNPVFACWLMGFPDELIRGVLRATLSYRLWRRKSSRRSSKRKA